MVTDFIVLVICTLAILMLGLLIFIRSPSLGNNQRFGLLSCFLLLWTVFNYLSDHVDTHVLLNTRLTFLFAVIAIYTLLAYIVKFPREKVFQKNIFFGLHKALTLLLLPTIMSPFFISSVEINSHNTIKTSFLYPIFVVYALYSFGLIVLSIVKQRKNAENVLQKQQVKIVSSGIFLYALLVMISSLILPLLRDNWSSSSYGPAFTLFLVATVGYAIVKHRLFDVKLIIARSLGYVGALTVLSTLYGLVILGVARFGFGLHFSLGATIFLSIATGLSGFTFHRLQTSFNKTTNKLFYRDAYDPQTFLDEFNKVLVAIYDLKPLLQESTKIISENLKPEYAVFEINKTATTPQKVISSPKSPHLNKEDMSFIRASVLKMRQKLIVTDDLDSKHSALQRKLGDTNISVVVRITSSLGNEGVGYLFLGPKKTGNPYSSQDVAVLEIVANELVIAIQNALRFEEIASFNITLQGKVNEATGKLRRANEKLKTLDETKDDFISMASHQLRTPLTSIKGYVSMVMEGDAGKLTPTQKEMLSQAFLSSQRMVYLIADLLNVSRLKTGKFIVEPAKVSLPKVIEEELSQLQKTAAGHKLKLVYSKPKDFPDLMLDETKIRQVIMNFIDNAIYYSKSGGEINIKLIDKPNTIELRVEDSGIGVPKSDQPHLFTKFYRAGNARKARPDGTGLGLFMAKKVIAAQGGALIFESQEGKGSTFGFMFNKAHLKPVSDAPNPKPAEPAIKLTHRNQ